MEEKRDSFLPEGLISDPRFFLEEIRRNLIQELDEKLDSEDKVKNVNNFILNNDQKYQMMKRGGNNKDSTTPQATDGIANEDEDDIVVKNHISKNWKRTVKLQIKALKLLMMTEYDKFMVLSSTVFIVSVIVYVLTGPEFFDLQGDNWQYSSMVLNCTQIAMMLV